MKINSPTFRLTRREMLKAIAAAGIGASLPGLTFGRTASPPGWHAAVMAYIESLSRGDGGYAWGDQRQSHLTPTFAAIGCYHLLKKIPPKADELGEFVRSHHPSRLGRFEQPHHVFEYQQIQSLLWLGEDASAFIPMVTGWRKPYVYFKQYEKDQYPIFQFEITAFICRALLNLPTNDLFPDFVNYLDSRRRANGSFNNTPAIDGSDGHVSNTWAGLQGLQVLGREEKKADTIAWLQSCQLANGGFTYQPRAEIAGIDDVAYVWAAARSLHQLGDKPKNREGCISYIRSLANDDGGFGNRPGWPSNAVATYRAMDSLEALGALNFEITPPRRTIRKNILPANLKVFSIQIEAHGRGSPAEAVELARALKIHLWGAKNALPGWLERARAIAGEQQVPVKFFVANEEYNTWVKVPGLGTYSHTSDVIAPADRDFGASLANKGAVSWPEFRERRLKPLQEAAGRLVWQFGENEELARIYLDDSLERGGYAAISTFHFGNPDFTNTEPFLQRYRGRIPFIALQDAHGNEPWWFSSMTTGFRTVFLGTEPSWEAWLAALERNWVAAIRHDAVSGFKTWMHGGSAEVVQFVCQHENDWRWWDNPEIQRPMVSIVPVRPEDNFEEARPDDGITLRVRCAWENTADAVPATPIAELIKLTVDELEVSPELVTKPHGTGLADCYYKYHLAGLAPGKHTATAVVRMIKTRAQISRTIEFMTL